MASFSHTTPFPSYTHSPLGTEQFPSAESRAGSGPASVPIRQVSFRFSAPRPYPHRSIAQARKDPEGRTHLVAETEACWAVCSPEVSQFQFPPGWSSGADSERFGKGVTLRAVRPRNPGSGFSRRPVQKLVGPRLWENTRPPLARQPVALNALESSGRGGGVSGGISEDPLLNSRDGLCFSD